MLCCYVAVMTLLMHFCLIGSLCNSHIAWLLLLLAPSFPSLTLYLSLIALNLHLAAKFRNVSAQSQRLFIERARSMGNLTHWVSFYQNKQLAKRSSAQEHVAPSTVLE